MNGDTDIRRQVMADRLALLIDQLAAVRTDAARYQDAAWGEGNLTEAFRWNEVVADCDTVSNALWDALAHVRLDED